MFFDGGAIGVEIGHSGFMGSENLFLNCFWLGCSTAGLLTSNPNALQQSVIGGNFQGCNRAIFAGAGSVPTIHGVGLQTSADCDIYTGTLSDNAMSVQGCRSESANFIKNAGGQSLHVAGCNHVGGSNGYFLIQSGGLCLISACISNLGNVAPRCGRACGSKTAGSNATTGCCLIRRTSGGSRTTPAHSVSSWRM
jgi:hypothetical protein